MDHYTLTDTDRAYAALLAVGLLVIFAGWLAGALIGGRRPRDE